MISCTEFIPSYSELFTYLENKHGREEVSRFWKYLFEPDGKGIPLIEYVKREGIRGCYSYWGGTLNEEAADFTLYLNERRGFFMMDMHKCPSKGRLLKLKDDIGIVPYHDYCLHCDSYRSAAEKAGLNYIFNFQGIDHASCSMIISDPKVFDGRIIIDNDTEIMERKASENEYFHRDFHSSMNMGIHYVGENYGMDAVREYLTQYTEHVYTPIFADMQIRGLAALESKILDTYEKEKALDAVTTKLEENRLVVAVHYCPAVKHLHTTGRDVSPWYRYTTQIVMEVLATKGGYTFTMEHYDEKTGAASYRFEKQQGF